MYSMVATSPGLIKTSELEFNILEVCPSAYIRISFFKFGNVIFILVITSLLLSCQTVERKIDKLSKEEEKNLNRFLGKQQINLIDEFGKPDNVIHESNKKTFLLKLLYQQLILPFSNHQ